jgi:hypothetical protein
VLQTSFLLPPVETSGPAVIPKAKTHKIRKSLRSRRLAFFRTNQGVKGASGAAQRLARDSLIYSEGTVAVAIDGAKRPSALPAIMFRMGFGGTIMFVIEPSGNAKAAIR